MLLTKTFRTCRFGYALAIVLFFFSSALPASTDGFEQDSTDRELKKLAESINSLNSEIDKIQELVLSTGRVKNLISISFKNNLKNRFSIRSIKLFLDEKLIYNTTDILGTWNSDDEIPLIFGPLVPGDHRVKFALRANESEESIFAHDLFAERKMEKDFSIVVPESDVKINYVLTLGGSDNLGGMALLNVEKTATP